MHANYVFIIYAKVKGFDPVIYFPCRFHYYGSPNGIWNRNEEKMTKKIKMKKKWKRKCIKWKPIRPEPLCKRKLNGELWTMRVSVDVVDMPDFV